MKTNENWVLRISLAIAVDNAILLEWGYSTVVVFLAFDERPKLLQIAPILVAFSYHGVNVLVIRLAALFVARYFAMSW